MPSSKTRSCDVFVSYAHKDRDRALALVELLKARGLTCWFDEHGLRGGVDYEQVILGAIRSAAVVMPLLSEAALQSDYVRYEVAAARGLQKPVVQVLLDSLPLNFKEPFTTREQITDLSGGIKEGPPLDRLIADLKVWTTSHQGRRQLKQLLAVVAVVLMLFGVRQLMLLTLPLGTLLAQSTPPAPTPASWSLVTSASAAENPLYAPSAYGGPQFRASPDGSFHPHLAFNAFGLPRNATNWSVLGPEASLRSGEHFFVRAETFTPGFLYIFLVDSSGKLQWLFPTNQTCDYSFGANPVPDRRTVMLPPDSRAYALDNTTGEERLFAVFSVTRWDKFEAALEQAANGRGQIDKLLSMLDTLADRAKGIARVDNTPADKEVRQPVDTNNAALRVELPAQSLQADDYWLFQIVRFRHVAPDQTRQP